MMIEVENIKDKKNNILLQSIICFYNYNYFICKR